jgi:NitT/TauT family transport system permease protein
MRIFGSTRLQIFRKAVVPSSLSWVFGSLKVNVGFAVLGAFIGEFISSEAGLGHLILRAGSLYDVPTVFAGSAVIVIMAFVFSWFVSLVEGRRYRIIELLSVPRVVVEAGRRFAGSR